MQSNNSPQKQQQRQGSRFDIRQVVTHPQQIQQNSSQIMSSTTPKAALSNNSQNFSGQVTPTTKQPNMMSNMVTAVSMDVSPNNSHLNKYAKMVNGNDGTPKFDTAKKQEIQPTQQPQNLRASQLYNRENSQQQRQQAQQSIEQNANKVYDPNSFKRSTSALRKTENYQPQQLQTQNSQVQYQQPQQQNSNGRMNKSYHIPQQQQQQYQQNTYYQQPQQQQIYQQNSYQQPQQQQNNNYRTSTQPSEQRETRKHAAKSVYEPYKTDNSNTNNNNGERQSYFGDSNSMKNSYVINNSVSNNNQYSQMLGQQSGVYNQNNNNQQQQSSSNNNIYDPNYNHFDNRGKFLQDQYNFQRKYSSVQYFKYQKNSQLPEPPAQMPNHQVYGYQNYQKEQVRLDKSQDLSHSIYSNNNMNSSNNNINSSNNLNPSKKSRMLKKSVIIPKDILEKKNIPFEVSANEKMEVYMLQAELGPFVQFFDELKTINVPTVKDIKEMLNVYETSFFLHYLKFFYLPQCHKNVQGVSSYESKDPFYLSIDSCDQSIISIEIEIVGGITNPIPLIIIEYLQKNEKDQPSLNDKGELTTLEKEEIDKKYIIVLMHYQQQLVDWLYMLCCLANIGISHNSIQNLRKYDDFARRPNNYNLSAQPFKTPVNVLEQMVQHISVSSSAQSLSVSQNIL